MSRGAENKIAVIVSEACLDCRYAEPVQKIDRLPGKRNAMVALVLGACAGEKPDTGVKVQFAPTHARHLFTACAGQEQKF
jgi:hypothetical protein